MRAEIRVEDMFDCRVINLARSSRRLEQFAVQNKAAGLVIDRFEAIDGSTVTATTVLSEGVVASGARYTPGAIGLAMSHRAIWRESIARKKCALVFEDDAILRRDIRAVLGQLFSRPPADWDIVLLGYNTDSVLDLNLWAGGPDLRSIFSVHKPTTEQLSAFAVSSAPVEFYKLNNAFGTCGYAISPGGAWKLLSKCFPMDNRLIPVPALGRSIASFGIDCMLNGCYSQVSAHACFTPLALSANDQTSSLVQQT